VPDVLNSTGTRISTVVPTRTPCRSTALRPTRTDIPDGVRHFADQRPPHAHAEARPSCCRRPYRGR
jgi:hypothetical protein